MIHVSHTEVGDSKRQPACSLLFHKQDVLSCMCCTGLEEQDFCELDVRACARG